MFKNSILYQNWFNYPNNKIWIRKWNLDYMDFNHEMMVTMTMMMMMLFSWSDK